MIDWSVKVTRVDNGYFVEFLDGNYPSMVVEYVEGDSEVQIDQLTFRKLCYILRDYYAVYNDKHTNQYLDIKVSGDEE